MKTLILAGGLGTRLREAVADRPKPMAPAAGKPFLEYLVEWLHDQGFDDLVLCVGHQADQVRDHFGDGRRWGVQIAYAMEASPLGTAGALKNARDCVTGTTLVLNGDSYLEVDLRAMVVAHRARRAADARAVGTLAAVRVEDTAAGGALEMDGAGRIGGVREKREAGPGWINGGIYVLEPEVWEAIPEGLPVSIERETFPHLLAQGHHLYAYPVDGFFVDIGTPQGYRRFQQYMEEKGL
ncbi:MAG TPA: nucleotidyltransferase family protein [Anaerolineae bacterium]|nr:nucleotidyltransferase family protein [Anaerolineae bacterium]